MSIAHVIVTVLAAAMAGYSGAVVTVARARWYAHIPFPLVYAAPVIAALALA